MRDAVRPRPQVVLAAAVCLLIPLFFVAISQARVAKSHRHHAKRHRRPRGGGDAARNGSAKALRPVAVTAGSSSVTDVQAVVAATVKPRGGRTRYDFQFGPGSGYGAHGGGGTVAGGVQEAHVGAVLRGLMAGTTYRYRVVASNREGTSYGAGRSFSTWPAIPALPVASPPPAVAPVPPAPPAVPPGVPAQPQPPAAATGTAASVTSTSASLTGSVNPSGRPTSYHFDYGSTSAYGQRAPLADQSAGSGAMGVPVSTVLSGLVAASVYHYRLVATSDAGTVYGSDQTFTTGAPPTTSWNAPSVPTGLTASPATGGVALSWNPNPSGDGVDGYQVYRDGALIASGSADPRYPNLATVTGTAYTDQTSGSHQYRVSAHNANGYGDWTSAVVAAPSGTGSGGAAIPAGATWFSTFEDANPWSKWEGYNEPMQLLQGGIDPWQLQVVDTASAGIPAPPGYSGSTKVLFSQVNSTEFHRYADNFPSSYCCVMAKLFHGWGGVTPGDSPAMSPGQESGSYRAWYYLPAATPTFPLNALPQSPSGQAEVPWAQLLQWKTVSLSSGTQVVAGEADLLPIDGKVWICFGGGWPTCWPPNAGNAVLAPLGQWFELRADFYHGSHVDWYINGQKVWTSTNVQSLQAGQSWIFGIGHYGGIGSYYAKDASFTPFG